MPTVYRVLMSHLLFPQYKSLPICIFYINMYHISENEPKMPYLRFIPLAEEKAMATHYSCLENSMDGGAW